MNLDMNYIRLLVADYPACFAFYRDVLGLPVVRGDEMSGYAEFQPGNVRLALFGRNDMSKVVGTTDKPFVAECQDHAVVIFAVPNVDEACEHLQSKGVSIITTPTDRADWGIRTAHFRDPDGTLIEINAPLG